VDPQQILGRLKAATAAMSAAQLLTLVGAFVGVVALTIGSAYWVNTPTYAVLFSDMDGESAGAVVTKLKTDKIPYLIDDGGRTVRVPAAQVDELRLGFTSQGMPASGRIGFEIFDRTQFGVTDFLEHVNYRRALEGELARTIATIAEVAGARVHIALPRETFFGSQEQATKASVVLKLRSSKPLAGTTVNGIAGLVAASVEGLRPESVVVIDNFGRSLARPADGIDEAPGGLQLEKQQRLEKDLSARVVALLEPIVGAGRARVTINARLNPNSQEETEERWDPTPVVRSRQSTMQGGAAQGSASALSVPSPGVAGVRGNVPVESKNAAATTPGSPGAATSNAETHAGVAPGSHSSEITNYELGRVTTHRVQPQGQLARLSVAVVIDDDHAISTDKSGKPARTSKPRSTEEIKKVHDLVAASVGLDTMRGDQLTVENISFEEPAPVEDIAPNRWRQYVPMALEAGRLIGVLLLGAFALFGIIRPAIKSVLNAPTLPAVRAQVVQHAQAAVGGGQATSAGIPAVAMTGGRTIQDLESEIEAELAASANLGTARRLPVLTRRVAAMAQREPENTARLVRTWLAEDDR
jgi:flagellar M-ring protein FliF